MASKLYEFIGGGRVSHSLDVCVCVCLLGTRLTVSAKNKSLLAKRNSSTDCRVVYEARKQSMALRETLLERYGFDGTVAFGRARNYG